MLNSDDTEQEQICNSIRVPNDILLNCEKCKRLFYRNIDIARKQFENHTLFCSRCMKSEREQNK